jgi:general secretion pathway protein G
MSSTEQPRSCGTRLRQWDSTITAALELFESDNGRFPTTAEGLAALRVRPADGKSWHGPYLAHDAGNDPWGNPYVYRYPGTHNPYSLDVFSMGPDGREGGGDDVGNW